jgi:hypothetical protein
VTVAVDVRASVYYKTHYLAFCVNSTSKTAPLSRPLNHASERWTTLPCQRIHQTPNGKEVGCLYQDTCLLLTHPQSKGFQKSRPDTSSTTTLYRPCKSSGEATACPSTRTRRGSGRHSEFTKRTTLQAHWTYIGLGHFSSWLLGLW